MRKVRPSVSTEHPVLSSLALDSLGPKIVGGEAFAEIAATSVDVRFPEPLSPIGQPASDASAILIDQCVRMDEVAVVPDNDNSRSVDMQCLQAHQVVRSSAGKQDATR